MVIHEMGTPMVVYMSLAALAGLVTGPQPASQPPERAPLTLYSPAGAGAQVTGGMQSLHCKHPATEK